MATLLTTAGCDDSPARTGLPRPDHIVVVIEEDQSYDAVIGSAEAPYLNQLARQGASLTQFYALTHPSQPNYLALFAGSFLGSTTTPARTGSRRGISALNSSSPA